MGPERRVTHSREHGTVLFCTQETMSNHCTHCTSLGRSRVPPGGLTLDTEDDGPSDGSSVLLPLPPYSWYRKPLVGGVYRVPVPPHPTPTPPPTRTRRFEVNLPDIRFVKVWFSDLNLISIRRRIVSPRGSKVDDWCDTVDVRPGERPTRT